MDNQWITRGDGLNNRQRIQKVMREQAARKGGQEEIPQETPKKKKKNIFEGLTPEQTREAIQRVKDGDEDVFKTLMKEEDVEEVPTERAEDVKQQTLLQEYHARLEEMRKNGGTSPWKVQQLNREFREKGLK